MRAAGAAFMEVYGREFAVAAKEDRSQLTEADSAAHRVIAARLAQLRPALPLLPEE